MTRPLRKAHAAIWMALPILLAIVFVASLLARRSTTPVNPQLRWEQFR